VPAVLDPVDATLQMFDLGKDRVEDRIAPAHSFPYRLLIPPAAESGIPDAHDGGVLITRFILARIAGARSARAIATISS
jgi:hypothetical protein